MSNHKNNNGQAVQTPANVQTVEAINAAAAAAPVENGTATNGGAIVTPSMVADALAVSPELQSYLDAKAREIAVIKVSAVVSMGGVLIEVKQHLKEAGHVWLPFLRRAEVNISEDKAARAMMLYRDFGKMPEELLTGINYSKLLALSSLNDDAMRSALLEDTQVRDAIKGATRDAVQAATLKIKEEKEQLRGSIEALKAQIVAKENEHKEQLKLMSNTEKGQLKVLDSQIERLKADLAAATGLQSKTDVDAVKQFREQLDVKQAELKALAGQMDKVQTENISLKTKQENAVTDKRLKAEIVELEAEMKDQAKKHADHAKELEKQLDEARGRIADNKLASVRQNAVNVPAFDFSEADLISFLEIKGLFDEFIQWFAERQAAAVESAG